MQRVQMRSEKSARNEIGVNVQPPAAVALAAAAGAEICRKLNHVQLQLPSLSLSQPRVETHLTPLASFSAQMRRRMENFSPHSVWEGRPKHKDDGRTTEHGR